MKVALFSPWENAWVPYFKRLYEAQDHEFVHAKDPTNVYADLYLHGWASGKTQPVIGAKNYFFMRRYELFEGGLRKVNWKYTQGLICVNTWIADVCRENFKERGIEVPVHVIYNGTDLEKWKFKERKPGKRLGMACHVHPKKNLPLALQILMALPEDYALHIAGDIQDPCTAEYLNAIGQVGRRKVYLYGHIEHDQLNAWWDQMDYCLSTSISEGNPNNVIEAMAKGIKPVVHGWPGSEDQFQGHIFYTVPQAVAMIQDPLYESAKYRGEVSEKFSLDNIEQVVNLTLEEEAVAA